jgi:hypothetical protein
MSSTPSKSSDVDTDVPPIATDFDTSATKTNATVSVKSLFTEHGCSVHMLFVLCHGLFRDDGIPALDVCEVGICHPSAPLSAHNVVL